MVKIVCWNINRSPGACTELRRMDADVALLQEVGKGAAQRLADILGEGETWDWKRQDVWPLVVQLSNRVKVDVFTPVAPEVGGITRKHDCRERLSHARGRARHTTHRRQADPPAVLRILDLRPLARPASLCSALHLPEGRARAPSEYSPTAPLTESSPTSPRSSVTRIPWRTACWWPVT